MPALKTYDLFLSHVWKSSENSEYNRLCLLLNQTNNFSWRNYSVPSHDPLGTKTDFDLKQALVRQIRPINCFIVVTGMYINYRKWIFEEIKIAQSLNKPIVGVMPWGQLRVPLEIQNIAKEIVGWNGESVASAVRRYAI
jgi:hypothetical protein